MAFTIPAHPTRKADVSTEILTKISEAGPKALRASLARDWVGELENAIRQTKTQIHDRIHEDLPAFESYLESSKSVQARLRTLETNVDGLSATLSHPDIGLVPSLLRTLGAHHALAQDAADSTTHHVALQYLSSLRTRFNALSSLVEDGKLADASQAAYALDAFLDSSPLSLARADVMLDFRNRLRATRARLEEQLAEAYSRSIVASTSELTIRPSIQVRGSSALIELPAILSALPAPALASQLATLRRALSALFSRLAGQSYDLTHADGSLSTDTHSLSFSFAQPGDTRLSTRLENLSTVLHFIGERLFPALPPAHVPAFAQSLAGPLSAALRDQLLVPGLPTDANELPTYLALAQDAVALEASFLKTVHGDEDDAPAPETPVAAWVAHVGAHYARARRVAVLSSARTTILSSASDPGATFSAPLLVRKTVTEAAAPPGPSIVAVQGEIGASPASARRHPTGAVSNAGSEDAWGLGEDESGPVANGHSDASTAENVEEASWGLDEDEDVSVETVPAMVSTLADSAEEVKNGGHAKAVKEPDGEDPDAAWGWTDDETAVDDMGSADTANVDKATLTTKPGEDEAAQEVEISDDPWDDDPWGAPEPPLAAPATPTPVPAMPASAPPIVPPASAAPTTTTPVKRARRLERLANKSRTTASAGTTPVERPPSQLPLPTHEHPHVAVTAPPTQTRFTTSELRPPAALAPEVVPPTGVAARKPAPPAVRTAPEPVGLVTVTREVELQESYAVSERARAVIALVRSTLDEGASLDVSSVLAAAARSEGASPGETIAMSAAAMLDLWRALAFVQLRPATAPHVKGTVKNLDATIRLANDALYMATAVADVLQAQGTGRASDASATLSESAAGMKVMAEQRYDDALADQEQAIDDILADADGFNGTDDQTVYDAAEDAVSRCMRHVRSIAHAWKTLMNKTRYYAALGQLVDKALSRVMSEVLMLDDITDQESQRLAELCRILDALQGLFVESGAEDTFVAAYVPSWMKFSYLPLLLEASIADIEWYFSEGALIDYDVEELAKLVRALFAETPLRAQVIARLLAGHPARI